MKRRKKTGKRALALFLTVIMAVTLFAGIPAGDMSKVKADGSDNLILADITVRYGQTEARSMLDMINGFRTGSEAWYWNEDDTTKTVYAPGSLGELTYDYNLEKIAMQRAAEIAVSFSHTRPDGQSCFTASYNGVHSWGENIAAGQATAQAVFTSWQETDDMYSGQGHRRNMLRENYKAVGIGHVYYNGYHYWVQEFGYSVSDFDETAINDSDTDVELEITKSRVTVTAALEGSSAYTMACGESMEAPAVKTEIRVQEAWPSGSSIVNTVVPEWVNENPDVIDVSGGRITAQKAGTAVLAAEVGDEKIEVSITVTDNTEEGTTEEKTEEGTTGEGTGENTGTSETKVLGNPRKDSDGVVTWDCVYFGHYPQAEVITAEMGSSYTAIGSEYLREGDLVVNDATYAALQNADGWDANGDITLNGVKYRRMQKSDATYSSSSSGYYKWTNSTAWHYFRYEPVKWRVLSADGKDAFLVSDIGLDDQKYNTSYVSTTWETSTLRSWLNGYGEAANNQNTDYRTKNFIGSAFSSAEQAAIADTYVVNDDNKSYGTAGGNDTADKLFLLSESEVYGTDAAEKYGFASSYSTYDKARQIKSSTYAKAMGTWWNTSADYAGNCCWWLRSPGSHSSYAMYVDNYGYVYRNGRGVGYDFAVCPALHLNLSSSNLWSYAGTVSSDGKSTEGENPPEEECRHENTELRSKKEASCTETGYTGDTYCADCGIKLEEGESVPARGHQWDAGVVTKEATATEDGVMTFICTICGESRTEVIKATSNEGTTEKPTDSTTEKPIDSTTEKPVESTTEKPADSTTEKPAGQPNPGTSAAGTEEKQNADVIKDSVSRAFYRITNAGLLGKMVEYLAPESDLTIAVIPDKITVDGITYKVTSIADNAFKDNTKVEKVTIGNNVKTIGNSAFEGCSRLKTVTFGKNITIIGAKAFYKCTKLTKITIPSKVSKIGRQAFYGCRNLKKITIKTKKLTSKKVGSKAFKGIYSKAVVKVPKSKLTAYKKWLRTKGITAKMKLTK